jgi:hypothetical protein
MVVMRLSGASSVYSARAFAAILLLLPVEFPTPLLADNWVHPLSRDPFWWLDLDSVQVDKEGYLRFNLRFGKPTNSPYVYGGSVRLSKSAIDCRTGVVFEVDEAGAIKREPDGSAKLGRQDIELNQAVSERICHDRR